MGRAAARPNVALTPQRGEIEAAADRAVEVDRVEARGLKSADESARAHRGRGRGIPHRRVEGALDGGGDGGAHGDAPRLGQLRGVTGEGGDERATLPTQSRQRGGVEVVLRLAQPVGEVQCLGQPRSALARQCVHHPGGRRGLAQRADLARPPAPRVRRRRRSRRGELPRQEPVEPCGHRLEGVIAHGVILARPRRAVAARR
ncbi:MAG: hypothetical protein DI573_07835 [Microbacterium sp.]|nr:MAG: hypothetical protein DI573_07835 [Microbacterium sp.]